MRYLKLLGILIFAYILWQLNWKDMFQVWQHIYWLPLIIAIFLSFLLVLTKASRWFLLVKQQGITYGYYQAIVSYICGLYLSFVTPGRLGDLIKAFHLKKEVGTPLASGFANVVFDRLLDVFFLLIMSTVALAYFFYSMLKIWSFLLPIGVLLSVAFLFFYKPLGNMLLTLIFEKLQLASHHSETVQLSFDRFHEGLDKLLPHSLISISLTLLANVFFYGANYLVARSLNIQVGLVPFIFLVSLSSASAFLPFSGLGAREAVFITVFSQLGLSKEQAVSYTTLSFLVFNLFVGISGFIFWQLKKNKSSIT